MRLLAFAVVAACTHARPPARDAPDAPVEYQRYYTIWFGGGRVGTAIETETWTAGGVVLHREETLRFLRGDATVGITTTIEIVASRALVPTRVTWREHHAPPDAPARRGASITAIRDPGGQWSTSAPSATIASDAVPAELVPLLARRDGRFAGRVFLPARGFLGGTGRVIAVGVAEQPVRLVARLDLDGGAVAEATIDVDRDGNYTRVVDGEGVIALRATPERAAVPYLPVDLIAATSIPIQGARSHTLLVDASVAFPPVPGQLARRDGGAIAVELSPLLPGDLALLAPSRDRSREITQLVAQVRARIAPDLAARSAPRDAGSATAGDCTTFALAYAALAARRAIPTRVVTGLRVDGDRLVRHRWTVSWTGNAWIAVDAAYGAVPAGGDLVGLAVHDADDAGLVAGEAALTQIRSAAWR